MSNASFDPRIPADRLASAWRSGITLKNLPEEERPQTLDQAYAVQAALLERLGEGGAGWKLAGASPRGLRGELPNPPATGVLVPSRIFRSGAVVQLPPERSATLEVEVAFRFSRTVSPCDEAFDPSSMIAAALVAVEVVCSRFADRKAVGQPSFVSDNVGFHALVCGDVLELEGAHLLSSEAGLWRNGEHIASALVGDDRTDPSQSLGFLWEVLTRQKRSIPAGAIVTTGTQTVPVDVTQAGYFEARIGEANAAFTLSL